MATLHAKLSASGSSRWLNCPGSVKAEEKQVETKAPEKQPEQTTAPTAEALQAKCMELVRADRKNKQVIKDLLAVYSASLISDLDEAQRAELAVKLGAL